MERPPFNKTPTRIALLDRSRRLEPEYPGKGGAVTWEMPLVSEQSCLRMSGKKL